MSGDASLQTPTCYWNRKHLNNCKKSTKNPNTALQQEPLLSAWNKSSKTHFPIGGTSKKREIAQNLQASYFARSEFFQFLPENAQNISSRRHESTADLNLKFSLGRLEKQMPRCKSTWLLYLYFRNLFS